MLKQWRVIGVVCCALMGMGASAALAAQKTATFNGGGDGVSYNDPANWDIAEVPINNVTDTFIVVIPAAFTVNYNVPQLGAGTNTVDSFEVQGASSTVNFQSGQDLIALSSSIAQPIINLQTGSTVVLPQTAYVSDRATTLFNIDGPATDLDMSATTTWTQNNFGGSPGRVVSVSGGANFNLSGLTTITNNSTDDQLEFRSTSGGTYDLSMLTTLNGPVHFNIDAAAFALDALGSATDGLTFTRTAGSTTSLANLLSSSGGTWNVPTGGSISAPELTQLRSTTINIGSGGTLNTPKLVDVQGSFISFGAAQTFTFSPSGLLNVDDVGFALTGGVTLAVAAPSYRSDRTGTIISVDGAGTTLDMSSVTNWTQNNFGGTPNRTVLVQSGGTLDLRNLATINNLSGDDRIILQTRSGGSIDLTSLQSIDGPVDFDFDQPNVSLPALQTFNSGSISVDAGGVFNATALTSLFNVNVVIGDGGTLNTTQLNDVSGSTINLGANQTFNVHPSGLDTIASTRFFLEGGAMLAPTAGAYVSDVTGTIIQVDGNGTLLDLSDVTNWTQNNLGGSPSRTVVAQSQGKIDLSGLATISNLSGDDVLRFIATSSGEIDFSSLQNIDGPVVFDVDAQASIKLGDITVTNQLTININDATSQVEVLGSLLLDANAVINVATGGGFSVGEHYAFETQVEANADLSVGALLANGAGTFANPQFIEIGGQDLGVPGVDTGTIPDDLTDPTAIPGVDGNFAIGELSLVGGTVAELRDLIDNGNRSSLEALYLPGLGGDDGLKLLDNSTLVINSINVYVFLNNDGKLGDTVTGGEWVHLNALIAGQGVTQLDLSLLTNDPAASGVILIPEPASMALLAVGACLFASRRRRR